MVTLDVRRNSISLMTHPVIVMLYGKQKKMWIVDKGTLTNGLHILCRKATGHQNSMQMDNLNLSTNEK